MHRNQAVSRRARHPSALIRNWREDLMDAFRKAERDHEQYLHRGRPREEAWRKVLRDFLPQRYGVASGHVVSSRSSRSRDADIILYDALDAPIFGSGSDGQGVIVPIESVFGIVEVKSTLSPKELADARDQGRAFKALAAGGPDPAGGTAPFACAVFFRLPTSKSKKQIDGKSKLLEKRLREVNSDSPGARLDAVLVLHADEASQGDWSELGADGMFVEPNQSERWLKSGPLAFSLFLDWLVDRLRVGRAGQPDIGSYLFEEGVETEPADPEMKVK